MKKADCHIATARPCGLMFDPSPLKDNPTRLEIDKSRSVYTQPRTLFPLQTTTTSSGRHPYSINLKKGSALPPTHYVCEECS